MSTTISKSYRFRSTTPNLNVCGDGARRGVSFVENVLVTNDESVAASLRQHPFFGREFWEENSAVQAEIAKVAADNPAPTDDTDKSKDGGEGKEKKPAPRDKGK